MEYKNYNNKLDVIKLLDDNQNVIETIIGAINGIDDQEWLEELCLKYITNDDYGISRTAIYGVSNIARIYGRLLNGEKIKLKFEQVKNENLKYVINEVEEDLKIFLK